MVSSIGLKNYLEYRFVDELWVNQIPKHWEVKKLFYLFNAKKGGDSAKLTKDYCGLNPGDFPVYSGQTENQGVMGKIDHYEFDYSEQGCLFSTTVGAKAMTVRFIKSKFSLSQNCMIIVGRDLEMLDLKFHFYAFQPLFQYFRNQIPDHMQASFRMEDLYQFKVLLPSKNEQTLIANFLDQKTAQIDEAIAIKEQQIALLKERKQIIIQKAVTQGLDPDVPMKDSGVEWIGEIPAHWETTRVKNLFRLVMEPSEKNNNHELLSVYTDIGVKPRRELEERGNKASTTDGYWFVKKGDIVVNKLLAWMGAIGFSEYDGVTSPAYDILRPQLPVNGYFYHHLFRSEFCSAELKRHSRGIMDMRLRLYFDRFGDVVVPYPPKEEQDRIIEQMEFKMTEIASGLEHLKLQIASLKEYKTALINSAVTGKIRITPEMVA